MSEEQGKSLTAGFTTIAEKRSKEDVHENIYADKALLLPTLGIAGACALGLILALVSML